jgi:hypothetical protein
MEIHVKRGIKWNKNFIETCLCKSTACQGYTEMSISNIQEERKEGRNKGRRLL